MLFCPRQCALIHIEQQWQENQHTAEGRVLHERPDSGHTERRVGVIVERSVPIRSSRLGISGIADVVEIREGEQYYPIEYKKGRPKSHKADEVQLCAQAMCLEEMLGGDVPEGALFYGRIRRRKVVHFDRELRQITEETVKNTRKMIESGQVPAAEYESSKCSKCSLINICQPCSSKSLGIIDKWLFAEIEH